MKSEDKTEGNSLLREVLDWAFHIAIAVALGLLIVTFVAQRTVVFNYSMEPTLVEGDNLISEKISPKLGKLKTGDIVTIKNASLSLKEEGKTIIKRIIAIENEVVDIRDGKVYINGTELTEPYIKGDFTRQVDPQYCVNYKVPEGFYYVLGDNRMANIVDSRSIGPIAAEKIESRAVFRILPFSKFGKIR